MSARIDDVICTALSEEHTYETDVTEHPVESGSDVTDNAINKPLTISLDCIISGTPLNAPDTAVLNTTVATANPVVAAQARLIQINNTREPITVIDSQGTFPEMVLEKLVFTKTIKTGEALAFKASFKALRIIDNERTVVQVAIPRVQSAVKSGTKASKNPPDNPPPPDKRSALRRVANRLGYKNTTPNQGGS